VAAVVGREDLKGVPGVEPERHQVDPARGLVGGEHRIAGVAPRAGRQRAAVGGIIGSGWLWPLVLGASVACAALSWFLIERPALRLKPKADALIADLRQRIGRRGVPAGSAVPS